MDRTNFLYINSVREVVEIHLSQLIPYIIREQNYVFIKHENVWYSDELNIKIS